MNNPKYLDRTQCIIGIVAIASTIIATILFIVMFVTAKFAYDESGAIADIVYDNILQTIFSIFFLTQLTAIVWFIARTITYKMRVKEEDAL